MRGRSRRADVCGERDRRATRAGVLCWLLSGTILYMMHPAASPPTDTLYKVLMGPVTLNQSEEEMREAGEWEQSVPTSPPPPPPRDHEHNGYPRT